MLRFIIFRGSTGKDGKVERANISHWAKIFSRHVQKAVRTDCHGLESSSLLITEWSRQVYSSSIDICQQLHKEPGHKSPAGT